MKKCFLNILLLGSVCLSSNIMGMEKSDEILMDATQTQQKINVASWNITVSFFEDQDKTPDKRHGWKQRESLIAKTINEKSPDILGVQELSPEQAIWFSEIPCYSSLFFSQTPSDVPMGIATAEQIQKEEWAKKRIGTPLVGILYKEKLFEHKDQGYFWLKEDPNAEPIHKDGNTTDKGFGNIRTYRGPLWVKLEHKPTKQDIFVFNSHYPLTENRETRIGCATVEREQIEQIAKDKFWISMGDRNTILKFGMHADDVASMSPLLKNAFNAVQEKNHKGPKTTWAGFTYEKDAMNPIENGVFQGPEVLDVMVSNKEALKSEHVLTQLDPKTNEITVNPEIINDDRYFASDHLMVFAAYDMNA